MNDRIRKIAIEADAWCDKYYFGDKFYDIEWETKFAELIVRECLAQVDKVDEMLEDDSEKAGVAWVGYAIEKHFGVEL